MDENFKINVKLSKVEKLELLLVKNPNYDQLLHKHDHLRGVTIIINELFNYSNPSAEAAFQGAVL